MMYRIVRRGKDDEIIKGPFVHSMEEVQQLVKRMQKLCEKGFYDYQAESEFDALEVASESSVDQKILDIRELKARGIYEPETSENNNRRNPAPA